MRHGTAGRRPAADVAVLVRDALPQTQLSSSINEPAFPSRPDITAGTARSVRGWEERSHAQQREHGEHRTFRAVSTVAD
jgi:hypothetical protein